MGEAHPFPYKVHTSFKLTQYIPTNYNYRSITTTSRHEEEGQPPLCVETAFFGATARVLPSLSGRNTFSMQRTPFPLLPMLPLSPSATHVHPLILTLKTWLISAVFVVLGSRHEKHGRNGCVSSLLTLQSSKWGPGRQTPVFCHAGSFCPHLHPSHHH